MSSVLRNTRIKDKLRRLATWTPEELEEEFSKWSDGEILELWRLLEPVFRQMCCRFGLIPPHRRTYARNLHQQIKRIGVLQKFTLRIGTCTKEG